MKGKEGEGNGGDTFLTLGYQKGEGREWRKGNWRGEVIQPFKFVQN